ncbi:MAG: class I SAM-dependent methyltransferase, partial [Chloroflexi bacterium]|nr:class I SAM-dependent methyltransferase [Chloroflexota bacterium]
MNAILSNDAFSRIDESDDEAFYARERFVSHLDSTALATIEGIIGTLIEDENPVILDLMASWDSHIPPGLSRARVVGLGLNASELRENTALSEHVIHDLNKEPSLPFADSTFDAVLCTVSADYLTHPIEVFREVGRVLKREGLFLVIFSNRMFSTKAVKVWREASEGERLLLVEDFFTESGAFEKPRTFISKGKPRPCDDKYAPLGIPSDPVYAVYALKSGATRSLPVMPEPSEAVDMPPKEAIERRKKAVKDTLACPYCGHKLSKWEISQTLFTEWPNEFFFVCLNDECPYFVFGWDTMARQNNHCSYRLMYDPLTDCCQPIPVLNHTMLKDGVV